jgi:hypothetical protein
VRRRKSIASPFENTQGRLRSFEFGQDDGTEKDIRKDSKKNKKKIEILFDGFRAGFRFAPG